MNREDLKRMLSISRGDEKAPLVLKDANVVNVFSHEIVKANVAVYKDKIVGIGDYEGIKEVNLEGKILAPGFVDSHVHIESSMTTPSQFAKVIVPRGTTTIIADPHEIANVKGNDGINFILEDSEDLPLDVYVMLPSCVPATPFENSGAVLKAEDLKEFIDHERVLGLGELMNYPGVVAGDEEILDKILLAENRIIDGHGPIIEDKELNTYVLAGVKTEHESSTLEELRNRIRLGMYILIREGSAARNLTTLVKGLTKENIRRCLFCTDDKHPEDILKDGHIDHNMRLAIKEGIDPIDAIKIGTLNAAECYGLKGKGAIAPGYYADLVVIDNLEDFNILQVFKDGKLVGENLKPLFNTTEVDTSKVKNSVNIKKVEKEDLAINLNSNKARIIKLQSHSLVTEMVEKSVNIKNGEFQYGNEDILKVAVVERHKATGNIGLGLVEGFKLKGGAIGSTIAHDSHNLIVIGDNDEDILLAINELEKIGGGITVVSKGEVLKSLPLEIGGIMSQQSVEKVSYKLKDMLKLSYEKLNVSKGLDPFMTLSFIALPVIPDIKITDLGLFHVSNFKFIDISV
ncbi:MAG TPA: adenine deaminase [Tissierellales bacterium]|nr:adenine deaminase [Tissierellales bacterium]